MPDALDLAINCSYIPLSRLRRPGEVRTKVVFGVVQVGSLTHHARRPSAKQAVGFEGRILDLGGRFGRAEMERI